MVANERTQIRPRRQIVEMAGGYIVGGSRPHKMLGADLVVRSHVASSGKPVAPKVVVDLMPRTERRRASKPKVRTGCKTCKIRHVKCDESRPICNRCRSSGFDCDGYPGQQTDFSERAILPKQGQAFADSISDLDKSGSDVLKLPWGSMFQTESDYRYFKFFEIKTARHLSGYFDTDVWGRLILQACEHEEFARHGVLALSALNKTIESISVGKSSLDFTEDRCHTAKEHHEIALKHYAKSLRLMRQRAADINDEYHLRNLLVSCLLTVCFETYHGNEVLALKQAVSGIKLLSHFQERLSSNSISMHATTNSGCSVIDPDLVGAFVRLEIVVTMAMECVPDQNHVYLQVRQATMAIENMPPEFLTLKEARHFWDIMIRRTIHWYHDESKGPLPSWRLFVPDDEFPVGAKMPVGEAMVETEDRKSSSLGQYLDVGAQWLKAFAPLFGRLRENPESTDFCGATVLMMYFLVARLSHPTTPDSQAIADSAELLHLAKEVLEPSSPILDDTSIHRPVFAFDGNLLSPIFCVVLRCRIRKIRWEAIALLKRYPRREGFWDSEMAVAVSEWFVNTEEGGLREDEEVSPDSRLILINNSFNLSERKTVAKCAWQVKGQPMQVIPPVTLKW